MSRLRGDIPEKIDRYEIIETIGFGAMGAVFKAFDPIIKRPVAVKTLRLDVPPSSPDYVAFLRRFDSEARTAGRLSHPNVVTLYDVGRTADHIPWLAMEYVDGQTVAELLEGERLRPEVVIGIVSQIASAIDYAHAEGVVHRDIKPSNVIVFAGEKVKVTDFGIAKLMDADVTHSGMMMGTPSYMSPEQAMGEDLDGSTDIFSLGVLAFEMLGGQQPFPGNNVTSILYKLVHAEPAHPDNLEMLGLLPHKWHEVFARALAKDPTARYPTAAAFVQDLELCLGSWFGALEGETLVASDSARTGPPPPKLPPPPPPPESEVDVPTQAIEREEPEAPPVAPGVAAELDAVHQDDTILLSPADKADATVSIDMRRRMARTPDAGVTMAGGAASSTGSETMRVPPPGEAEKTLYAGTNLDETVRDGAEASRGPAPGPRSAATIRKRPSRTTKFLPAAAGVVAAALAAVLLLVRGAMEAPAPPPEMELPAPPPLSEPEPVVAPEAGSLHVVTEPPGARVFLDGREAGLSPLEFPGLPMSSYDLRVEHPGFLAEEVTAELTPESPDAAYELALRPAPRAPRPTFVRVDSDPAGAEVEIDGRSIGTTPVESVRVAPGSRTVRVLLDGFLPWEDTIRASEGTTETVAAILTPRRPVEPEPEAPPPEPEKPAVGQLVERGAPGVVDPRCVLCPPVPYPPAAREARLEGIVELDFLIDENGRVEDVQIVRSGGPIFDEAVIEKVRGWRYQPATKDGVPVKMRWMQRFRFQQGR